MKTPVSGRELYISEISYSAEEEDLRKLFVLFGTVNSVHMVKDPKSGLFKRLSLHPHGNPGPGQGCALTGRHLPD